MLTASPQGGFHPDGSVRRGGAGSHRPHHPLREGCILEPLQESVCAGLRVFTPTANSCATRGGVQASVWMFVGWGYVRGHRPLRRGVPTVCAHVPSGSVTLLSPPPNRGRPNGAGPYLPPALPSPPGGRLPTRAASSVDTWLCEALCLDPIFVIYIFRNSVWSGLADLLQSEHCVLV